MNCQGDSSATVTTFENALVSDHNYNSFCHNTGKRHSLYPSGNYISFLNSDISQNKCSTAEQYGAAASFTFMTSPSNVVSYNNYRNCSKAPGILAFYTHSANARIKYINNIHLYCVSSSYIVTSEASFNPISIDSCIFFGNIATNFAHGGVLTLTNCYHDFKINGNYNECQTINKYDNDIVLCHVYNNNIDYLFCESHVFQNSYNLSSIPIIYLYIVLYL